MANMVTAVTLTYAHGNYRFDYYTSSGGVVVSYRGRAIDGGFVTDTLSEPYTMTDLKRWAARWAVNDRARRRRIQAITRMKDDEQ